MEIIYDEKILKSIIANPVNTLEEGQAIATELFKILASQKTAPGLSAAQVGINKRVIVVNVREPLYFVNPEILDCDILTPYPESCVNYPQKICFTGRYARILLKADNLKNPIWIGLPNKAELNSTTVTHPTVMEAVYIQQTVESLNGYTMWDFELADNVPEINNDKRQRNELVTLIKDEQEIKIKYKRVAPYLKDGWTLKEIK